MDARDQLCLLHALILGASVVGHSLIMIGVRLSGVPSLEKRTHDGDVTGDGPVQGVGHANQNPMNDQRDWWRWWKRVHATLLFSPRSEEPNLHRRSGKGVAAEERREMVLAAAAQNGHATLKSASAQFQALGDREVVLAAVAQNGFALEFASAELQGDRKVVLVAVAQDGCALEYASAELKGDPEVVLVAVAQDGCALKYASADSELKGDREVVLVAVAQDGDALGYASAELKGDREVVLAAVSQCGRALWYASAETKGDREVVLAAAEVIRSLGSLGPKAAR